MAQRLKLYDEDLIVRFVSLVDDWRHVDASIADHATAFMRKLLADKKDIKEETINRFYRVLKLLEPLGGEAFRVRSTFSSSLFDAVMVALAGGLAKFEKHPDKTQQAVEALKYCEEFRKMRGSASSKSRTRKKIELAIKKLEAAV